MTPARDVLDVDALRARARLTALVELAKPRVVTMVLITTGIGFYLASTGFPNLLKLLPTLLGTGLAAAGTLALNQFMERDVDAKMERTRHRPLPERRVQPRDALRLGIVLTVAGVAYLALAVNAMSASVTAVTSGTYLLLYTPMKRKSPLCGIVGAVPGALPPVTGWLAAGTSLGVDVCILFLAILSLWQLPHSLAIARLYRDDYARAGIRVLPVVEPDARSRARQMLTNCLALLLVGLSPTLVGLAGPTYFLAALVLGGMFLGYGVAFARSRTEPSARQLLFASLLYLPALFIAMALDKVTL